MSNQTWNRILMTAISILTVVVVVLTTLIIREGKPVRYDELYPASEEAESNNDVTGELEKETEEAEAEEVKKVIMTTTRVNVRSTDSEDGRVLDTVEEGAIFEFVEVLGNGWTHIKYQDQDAYINSKFVKLVDADKAVEQQTEATE